MSDDPRTDDRAEDSSAVLLRRSLLGGLGLAAIGGLTAAALGLTGNAATPVRAAPTASPAHDPTHSVAAVASPSATPPMDHDAEAEAKVKAFPAKTNGAGLQELRSTVVSGVREFDLTCDKVRWEVTPGVFADGISYNSQIPGPIIRVTEGERVRIRVKNN